MMGAMRKEPLEPGLLPTFRLFVALRVVLLAAAFWWQLLRPGLLPLRVARGPQLFGILLGLGGALPLLGYLWWPALQRRLGAAYLPLALAAETGSILLSAVSSQALQAAAAPGGAPLSWPVMVTLALPLILTAWQYGFAGVLIFAGLLAGAELLLAVPLGRLGYIRPGAALVVAVVRGVLLLLLGIIIARLGDAQRAQRRALAAANQRLAGYALTMEQLAVSRERNRLARELHDTLAHSLSAVAVQLEAVDALWEQDPPAARQRLQAAAQATRSGLSEARRAIQALRAAPLEEGGLLPALRALAEERAAAAGWALQLRLPPALPGLDPDLAQTLYRVAAEALANAARHAAAQRVSLSLEADDGQLVLEIRDDGRGFDRAAAPPPSGGHVGLQVMAERAALHGGTLEIAAAPGAGTTVTCTVRTP